MEKIALIYAPAKGNTERVAKLIRDKIGHDKVDLLLVEDTSDIDIITPYSKVIFGISTVGRDSWDANYTKIGWDFFLPKLDNVDFKGKTVAIFGLGDLLLYSNNFVDAMGWLGKVVESNGANLVGKCSTEGYNFNDSEAVEDGSFFGLPIDEDNESEHTNVRVDKWLKQIAKDLGF